MKRSTDLSPLLSLDGRVALVTGAGGGIGSVIVQRLLDAGARVAAVDLPGKPCVEQADRLTCDVASKASVDDLFAELRQRFDRLDILVHAAGITRDAVLWKMDEQAWCDVLRVNLESAFLVLKRAVPMMRSGNGGSIVLVSSINAERGKFGQSNYAASKAGLIGLARSVARETGRFGIRVNVVSPGWIDTAMTAALAQEVRTAAIDETALGALGEPDDVARAVWFLVSPMSRHVTGQILRVDGGQLMA